MSGLLQWLIDQVWPNIVATILCGIVAYLWKIRPHLRRQAAHREHVANSLAELHKKADNQSGGL